MTSVKEWLQDRGVKHQEVELIQRVRHRKLWHDMIAYIQGYGMAPGGEREREREIIPRPKNLTQAQQLALSIHFIYLNWRAVAV